MLTIFVYETNLTENLRYYFFEGEKFLQLVDVPE